MEAIALARALEGQAKNQALTVGFTDIVRAYSEEYTDATEIDGHAYSALEALWDICFYSGENDDGKELDTLIAEVKVELGRK